METRTSVNPILLPTRSAGQRRMKEGSRRTAKASLARIPSILVVALLVVQTHALSVASSTRSKLGLLSFDLDDTLFPTGKVVKDANDAMLERMNEMGCIIDEETFIETTKKIRQGLSGPVTYTDLRISTIRAELERSGMNDVDRLAMECFDVWLQERQESANRNLFDDVVDTLRQLKDDHPHVCIAAITNGRGDPLEMSNLRDFFDFCVSGEDEDVFPERKPSPGIYKAALRKYKYSRPSHKDDYYWIHVGDCVVNDVGAAASLGAKTVWKASDEMAKRISADFQESQPKWSTATKSDLEKRKALASEARQRISTRIQDIGELPSAITELLSQDIAKGVMK